jgi:hypothetical protein
LIAAVSRSIGWIKKPDFQVFALLTLVCIIALQPAIYRSQAQTSSNLSILLSTNLLVASQNRTVLLKIENVGNFLKELDIALALPPPLVLFGDNHWSRSTFAHGEMISANLTIFAPAFTAGTTAQGSIVGLYKVIGEANPSTETHTISFLIRGWIDLKVYEMSVSPDPVLAGSELTISGSILNRGVIPVMYANVTIVPDPPLVENSIKSTYVGEVDPNAPAPFSVTALVDPSTTTGTYRATIVLHYRDDLQLNQVFTTAISFAVVAKLPQAETTKTGIVEQVLSNPGQLLSDLLSNQMIVVSLGALLILAIASMYLRRRRRHAGVT